MPYLPSLPGHSSMPQVVGFRPLMVFVKDAPHFHASMSEAHPGVKKKHPHKGVHEHHKVHKGHRHPHKGNHHHRKHHKNSHKHHRHHLHQTHAHAQHHRHPSAQMSNHA